MPTLQVKNIRSIASAEIDLEGPITLLAGLNGMGKSSLLLALKALLTGTTACITGKATLDGKLMCSQGSGSPGTAILSDGDAKIAGRWSIAKADPARSSKSVAGLPKSSATAAGLPDFLSIEPKLRDVVFSDAFQIAPTCNDLKSALLELDLGDRLDDIWDEVDVQGWDGVFKLWGEKITTLKAVWRDATGEQWTEDGAVDWAPIAGDKAISDEQYNDLQEKALASAEKLARARNEMASIIVPPAAGELLCCPHCEKEVVHVDGSLQKPTKVDEKARDVAIAKRQKLQHQVNDFTGFQDSDERALILADGLRERDSSDRDERIRNAAEANAKIKIERVIQELLGPDGVRSVRRDQMLHLVNNKLLDLSEGLTPSPVRLVWCEMLGKKTMTFCGFMGSTPYEGLSKSEQWRVRTIVQVAIASQDGSSLILLDDADILNMTNREALISLLHREDIKAVVAMTMNGPDKTPDLQAAGLGRSYWVEGGRVKPLAEAKQAAMQAAA